MKNIFTNVLILTGLLLSSACSANIKSSEQKETNQNQVEHGNHQQVNQQVNLAENKQDTNNQKNAKSNTHDHSHTDHNQHTNYSKITTTAKLTPPQKLAAKESVNLVIDIQDDQQKPVTKFDVFQEKLMHLIVVSDDLRFFDHLHPEYKNNGRFEVTANFSEPGNYTFFSDYKPSGKQENISVMKVNVPGSVPLPKDLEKFAKTKTISDTKVNLNVAQTDIKSGQEVSLKFDIQDAKSNQSLKDLQPYLGEKGHLVIIKSSAPLTVTDYIHAHASQNSPDGQIEFKTQFPQPGTYKMWFQFNRNGKITTADFWVNVV